MVHFSFCGTVAMSYLRHAMVIPVFNTKNRFSSTRHWLYKEKSLFQTLVLGFEFATQIQKKPSVQAHYENKTGTRDAPTPEA